MSEEKITVSWDDLNTRKVDTRLKEQDALARNREYARMNESTLPSASCGSCLANFLPSHRSKLLLTPFVLPDFAVCCWKRRTDCRMTAA